MTEPVQPIDEETRPLGFATHLYILSAMFFFIFMGAGAQQAYLVPYLRDVTQWSGVMCGGVLATVYISMLIFRLANVYLFPHWSDRRFTIVGSLSYLFFTLAMFATAYLHSYAIILVSAFLWGAGAAMMWTGTAMQTLSISDRAENRHGTGMGILYSSTHAGWLVGAILLGNIYHAVDTDAAQILYAVAAGITLIGNVLSLFIPATGQALRETPAFMELMRMVTRGRALISGILQFTSALGYGLFLGVFSVYMKEQFGTEWIWLAVALYPATRMVMSFASGYLTDHIGHSPVLSGGFLIGAAGLIITVMWRSPFAASVTGFTLGLLGSTVPVVAAAIVGDASDTARRPLSYGIVFGWRDLGVAVAAVGSNIIGIQFEMHTVFVVFAYVFAACALLSVYLSRFADQDL